ncbi:MAG: hypothetical protein ABJN52_01655 [Litorimonas sp.]
MTGKRQKRGLDLPKNFWSKIFGLRSKRTKPRAVLSCVVDQHPKFLIQAWIWLVSAKSSGAFKDCDVVIHHVGDAPDVLRKAAARFGARLYEVELFGEGAARYCNKLQSHGPVLSSGGSGVLLTDVDLFFLESPIACLDSYYVQSKVVDHANPSSETLSTLAQILNLPVQKFEAVPTFRPDSRTHKMNCNGGLYALPMACLEALAPYWREYSNQCLAETGLLGKRLHHSDQIGFLMSMIKTELPFRELDIRYNFPTHLESSEYDSIQVDDISIIHYHDKICSRGRLIETGHAGIDTFINRANHILKRYEHHPEYKEIQSIYAASL